jgi:hypothetical protein
MSFHDQSHQAAPSHGGSAKELESEGPWERYAHYAHKAHLAAEGVEVAAEKLGHAGEFVEHVRAAAKLVKTHSQMAYDLRRMSRGLGQIERVAMEGGARGAKARAQLSEARAAFRTAESTFVAERDSVAAAHKVLHEFKLIQDGAQGKALVKLGQSATELESALGASRVGSALLKVGRVTSSKAFINGLIVVGAACEGIASFTDSTAQTTTGKAANAALGAGAGALTMMNPYVAGADILMPEGYKLSEVYHGGAGAVTAIGEGLMKGDTRPMDEFHKRSMEGHYGKVIKAASEAGQYWADKGVVGGFKEFVHAVHWWVSQ